MVLIAALIVSKGGKPLVTRQFIADMTRARLEGLAEAFPKLVGLDSSRQHTFVETDSVRYVYQPLDQLYMVLVTTKNSNILEDLETLKLFSRVIPEYCRSNDEKEVFDKTFDLIFAFDEIITLGYRESVNLAQIRTFTEMDSHEERVHNQIVEAQIKQAKEAMRERQKEIERKRKDAELAGKGRGGGGMGGIGSTGISSSNVSSVLAGSASSLSATSSSTPAQFKKPAPSGGGKALRLGAKSGGAAVDDDQFIAQLRQEGQTVVATATSAGAGSASIGSVAAEKATVKREPVHVRIEEKLTASIGRDGNVEAAEVAGTVSLSVASPDFASVSVRMRNGADANVQLQVHPNLDKKEWQQSAVLRLKAQGGKPFPIGQEVGVLKWRRPLQEDADLPLTLNVWPDVQAGGGGCQVNIEWTLQRTDMQLNNVHIVVPLPPASAPSVGDCDGAYEYVKSRSQLVWTVPVIDASNASGTLEFSTAQGQADAFFPVQVRFDSEELYVDIKVTGVEQPTTGTDVTYSTESRFAVEKYDIV